MKSDNLFVHWSETQLSLIASLRYIGFAFIYQIIYSALDCTNVVMIWSGWMRTPAMWGRCQHQHQHRIRRISLNEFTICVSFWHLHFSDRVNICRRNWSSPRSRRHTCMLHKLNSLIVSVEKSITAKSIPGDELCSMASQIYAHSDIEHIVWLLCSRETLCHFEELQSFHWIYKQKKKYFVLHLSENHQKESGNNCVRALFCTG